MMERTLDNGTTEARVEVELLDTVYQSKYCKDLEGQWWLIIQGEKKIPTCKDQKAKEKLTENNRECGPFKLLVRLPRGNKNEGHQKIDIGKGIVQYIVNFSEKSEQSTDK